MRTKSFLTFAAAVLAVGALAGGLSTEWALASNWQNERLIRSFATLLQVVQDNYHETTEPDRLVEGAINGMLRTLDPHSHYLNIKAYRSMREEQQGSFSGLGIVIQKLGRDRPLTVISPIDGTPAARLGIRAGDIISRINGESTAGLLSNDAVERLRGPKGTDVHITITRPGFDEPLEFTITRDTIPTDSVVNPYMIEPGTAYLKIRNFTQTTDRELQVTLEGLKKEGMQRLVLDLRGNPGGLLDQAVAVADKFLDRGEKLVYTRGRIQGANKDYYASDEATYPDLPLVILVNRGSASASEIVAGAIQDHDRGLIVGETTWGKGLVQSVFPLTRNNALALTTAKYYTPSGRLIQRDYVSLEDYVAYRTDENYRPSFDRDARKYTDAGRTVFGGGGIAPDVEVQLREPSEFITRMYRTSAFFRFAVEHLASHPDLTPDFEASDEVMEQFRLFLLANEIPFVEADLIEDQRDVRMFVRAEVLSAKFGLVQGDQVRNAHDEQVQMALTLFPQARELALLADRPDQPLEPTRQQ
jgi:carboxyl-terminal processing protease